MTRLDIRNDELKEKAQIKRDTFLKSFIESNRQQRHDWIDNNVNSMADAKLFLKRLSDIVALTAKEAFKDGIS